MGDLTIRQARLDDLDQLADLHVATWNEPHGLQPDGPSFDLRRQQWELILRDPNEFTLLALIAGDMIGLARGRPYSHADIPGRIQRLMSE